MQEIWKDVIGYEGLYKVSNLGRVKSLERTVRNNKDGGIRVVGERILKNVHDGHYLGVTLCKSESQKRIRVHQLVAKAFIDNSHNKKHVNHINGIRTDNKVSNLEWLTPKENSLHAVNIGLIKKGEFRYNSKLTDLQREEIRLLTKKGESGKDLANKYGVSMALISLIKHNK